MISRKKICILGCFLLLLLCVLFEHFFESVSYNIVPHSVLTNVYTRESKGYHIAVATMVTSDDYIDSANVLYFSLHREIPSHLLLQIHFIALLIENRNNDVINSKLQGWNKVYVPLLAPPTNNVFPRFRDQFTKLHLWNMVYFSRIVYLDSDTLCVGDISALFKNVSKHFGVILDWESGMIQKHFNMGVFSIAPNADEFKRLNSLRVTHRGYRIDTAEQGFLNSIYRDHTQIDIFPFEFNGNLAAAVQSPLFWKLKFSELKIIHYTWIKPFDVLRFNHSDYIFCNESIKLWYVVKAQMIGNGTLSRVGSQTISFNIGEQ